MLVKDLDGNESELNISRKRNRSCAKSQIFKQAVILVKELYPALTMCFEISIKVQPGKILFLDLYVPALELAVEVHGKQHFEFTPHYHKHKHRFGRACLNDMLKKEWCELNKIRYVELKYDESREQWADKLRRATGQSAK